MFLYSTYLLTFLILLPQFRSLNFAPSIFVLSITLPQFCSLNFAPSILLSQFFALSIFTIIVQVESKILIVIAITLIIPVLKKKIHKTNNTGILGKKRKKIILLHNIVFLKFRWACKFYGFCGFSCRSTEQIPVYKYHMHVVYPHY